MTSTEDCDEIIKSQNSRSHSFLKFVNRTSLHVDIIWRGFRGEYIRYSSRLNPGGSYCVNTFESHPWQAWNSDTLQLLNVGGQSVHYPQKWNGENKHAVIYIDEPVHTLVRLCLEKIKSLVTANDSDKLQIPKFLCDELKKRRMVEVQDYISQGQSQRRN